MSGHLYFEIQADDMERASGFNRSLSGWKFHKHESQNDISAEYLRIDTGGTAGGKLRRHSETPPPECGTGVSSVRWKLRISISRLQKSKHKYRFFWGMEFPCLEISKRKYNSV